MVLIDATDIDEMNEGFIRWWPTLWGVYRIAQIKRGFGTSPDEMVVVTYDGAAIIRLDGSEAPRPVRSLEEAHDLLDALARDLRAATPQVSA